MLETIKSGTLYDDLGIAKPQQHFFNKVNITMVLLSLFFIFIIMRVYRLESFTMTEIESFSGENDFFRLNRHLQPKILKLNRPYLKKRVSFPISVYDLKYELSLPISRVQVQSTDLDVANSIRKELNQIKNECILSSKNLAIAISEKTTFAQNVLPQKFREIGKNFLKKFQEMNQFCSIGVSRAFDRVKETYATKALFLLITPSVIFGYFQIIYLDMKNIFTDAMSSAEKQKSRQNILFLTTEYLLTIFVFISNHHRYYSKLIEKVKQKF